MIYNRKFEFVLGFIFLWIWFMGVSYSFMRNIYVLDFCLLFFFIYYKWDGLDIGWYVSKITAITAVGTIVTVVHVVRYNNIIRYTVYTVISRAMSNIFNLSSTIDERGKMKLKHTCFRYCGGALHVS